MYFILEVDNNIFNIYDDRNAALIHLYKLNKFSKQIQLNEFKNGYINGEYIIKNNIIYYSCLDSSNNISIVEIHDLPYEIKKVYTKKLTMNVDQINVNVSKVEETQKQKTEKQEKQDHHSEAET
jgi:hypothetical protein